MTQVDVEVQWLPWPALRLLLPVPEPIAVGRHDQTFPLPWSVRRWLPGSSATDVHVGHLARLAVDLARFPRRCSALTHQVARRPDRDRLSRWCAATYDDETTSAIRHSRRDRRRPSDGYVARRAGNVVGSPGRRGSTATSPDRTCSSSTSSARSHRLRLCRRRRPSVRSGDRLVAVRGDEQPKHVPAPPPRRRPDVGTRPWVGTLERP